MFRDDAAKDGRDEPSDESLADATRRGDLAAFEQLWLRHSRDGFAAARRFSTIAPADDLVAEGFVRILRALRGGGGPRAAFRPYLYRTIRNVAMDWREASEPTPPEEVEALVGPREDPTESIGDRNLTARAFLDLPERWRAALWFLDVEEHTPAQAAPLLGLSPNATSALLLRAREGFNQAWIQAHVSTTGVPADCAWTNARVGRYTRGALNARDTERYETHLERCERCPVLVAGASRINGRLAGLLLPIGLGAGIALGAAGSPPATGAGHAAASAASRPASRASQGSVAIGGAVGATAIAAAAVALVAGAWMPTPGPAPIAQPSIEAAAPQDPSSPPSPAATVATPVPSDSAEAGPGIGVDPVPPAAPEPVDPKAPAPRVDPAPAPTRPALRAPTIDPIGPLPLTYLPVVSGSALPGATVTVVDDLGSHLGTALADLAGFWCLPLPDSGRDGATIAAWQLDTAGTRSPLSEPSAAFVFDRPSVVEPADGETVASTGGTTVVHLRLSGVVDSTVELLIDGVADGTVLSLTDQLLVYNTELLPDGPHELAVRYVDAATGRVGLLMAVHILIE